MGMYTELHFNAELKRDLPQQVIDALADMTGTAHHEPGKMPDHPLFATGRWDVMLVCDSSYFPMQPATSFVLEAGRWHLSVRSNFKDYDGEVDHFLDWIRPYLADDEGCLGFYRYEEDAHPTLIYATGTVDVAELIRAGKP